MKNIDFPKITACGECCVGCKKKEDGLCEGCIESDGHCKEWAQSKGCPIHKCAKQHKVQFCGLCSEFPCDWLVEKITWNPNVVEDLNNLAKKYKEQTGGLPMQPKIIKKDRLYITGFTGDGSQTLKVWTDFDTQYNKNPFPKADESGYEIRFWQNRKTGKEPAPDKSVHVGFLIEKALDSAEYTTIVLPAAEYAVFDVYVAKGYDSGNEEMEKWLDDNKFVYGLREFDGYEYILECYNEKFKGGDKPDSIVEIWLPLLRFCQSCYMPMIKPEDFCTDDYCRYCGDDFTGGLDLTKFVEQNIQFWRDGCKNDDEARVRIMEVFPNLKRWVK